MSVGLRGQVLVNADDQLSQDAIRQRLTALGEFLHGRRRQHSSAVDDASAGGPLADRARALEEQLDGLETHDMKIFQIGLVDIGPRLGEWARPTVPADTVADEVKEKIVMSEKVGWLAGW